MHTPLDDLKAKIIVDENYLVKTKQDFSVIYIIILNKL